MSVARYVATQTNGRWGIAPNVAEGSERLAGLRRRLAFEGTYSDGVTGEAPTVTTNLALGAGRFGQGMVCGAGRFLSFGSGFVGTGNRTIGVWVAPTVAVLGVNQVAFGHSGVATAWLGLGTDGRVRCDFAGGAITGGEKLSNDVWAHVAVVIDAGAVTLYLNGVGVGSGTGSVPGTATRWDVGSLTEAEPLVGALDELLVFEGALTATEVANLATATAAVRSQREAPQARMILRG